MKTKIEKIKRMVSLAKSGFMGGKTLASDDTTSQFSV